MPSDLKESTSSSFFFLKGNRAVLQVYFFTKKNCLCLFVFIVNRVSFVQYDNSRTAFAVLTSLLTSFLVMKILMLSS